MGNRQFLTGRERSATQHRLLPPGPGPAEAEMGLTPLGASLLGRGPPRKEGRSTLRLGLSRKAFTTCRGEGNLRVGRHSTHTAHCLPRSEVHLTAARAAVAKYEKSKVDAAVKRALKTARSTEPASKRVKP